jgi:hypothetical protein
MIEAFIRKKGVTKCPAPFTPEMRELNLERQRDWQANHTNGWRGAHARKRRKAGLA